jgi:prepilin-type N-terminal cleavage/methylation domain-containing protein
VNLSGRRQAALHLTDAGFSLVEAMVALAIMGIMMALAVGGRSLIDNRRLVGAARTLATDMRWVEQRARTERRCWRIEFAPAGRHYHIQFYQFLPEGSWAPGTGCTGGTWTELRQESLPSRINLVCTSFPPLPGCDAAVRTMTVSHFGNPNGGAARLGTPGGMQREVTVNIMGRVTITPYPP